MHYEKDRLAIWSYFEVVVILQVWTNVSYIFEEFASLQMTYLDGQDSMYISMTLILLYLNVF